jgi:hypothetical protein
LLLGYPNHNTAKRVTGGKFIRTRSGLQYPG